MNILIIGSGGREHALAWKINQSPKAEKVFIAPGNSGTASLGENISLDVSKSKKVIGFCFKNNIGLVIIGPDDILVTGLVDSLAKVGIKIFGPTKVAAEIEWSKVFAKKIMKKVGIPTAEYREFKDAEKAEEYIKKQVFPLVIKANGLALGKGVKIVNNLKEAGQAIDEIMIQKAYGNGGDRIIIEEFLEGPEISIHAFCDGKTAVLFLAAQDHKRIFDGDKGSNTGGMGTIAPVPCVSDDLLNEIKINIVEPLLKEMKKMKRKFVGLLFPGMIITKKGPKVLEFNARFGDPETQVYMRLLKSDLLEIMMACIDERLDKIKIEWEKSSACCVVLASEGYPEQHKKGFEIAGLEKAEKKKNIVIFHAGTKIEAGKILTNGGRIFGVTAKSKTLESAIEKTYNAVSNIKFKGMQYRRDIGKKSLF